jgi:hypothetical protein
MTAPTLPEQIAAINSASEIIAANGASIRVHGWKDDEVDATQIGLGAARASLEWLGRNPWIREEYERRKALAKNEEPA